MNFDAELESRIGIFDLAISFASDAEQGAESIHSYADAYTLRCYKYDKHLVNQSGCSLTSIMRFVYRNANAVIVLNSPLYLKSSATRFEWQVLTEEFEGNSVFVVNMGGKPLMALGQRLSHFDGLTDRVAMEIMKRGAKAKSS